MRKVTSIIAGIFLAFALTACGSGGGGSDPDPKPVVVEGCTDSAALNYNSKATKDDGSCKYPEPVVSTISGKAFDGYIVGGTAWMDINGDGVLNEDEPSSITKAGGDYSIDLTEAQNACLAWSTIYVDVPVGAIDEQEGEVLEAYRMSFPPSLDPDLEQEGINISPLTTVVWESVVTALRNEGRSISCATLSTDQELSSYIRNVIDQGMEGVVRHYNIPLEKIFTDFIADGDTELQEKAVKIVGGLQASLAKTIELSSEYPDSFVQVKYYTGTHFDDWQTPDQWYNEIWIWDDNGVAENIIKSVDDTLDTEIKLIYHKKSSDRNGTVNGEEYRVVDSIQIETRFGNDYYTCEVNETFYWFVGEKQYTINNIRFGDNYEVLEDCELLKLNPIQTQNVFVSYSTSETLSYRSQFVYLNGEIFDGRMIAQNIEDDDVTNWTSIIETNIPYRYIDRGTAGSYGAHRTEIKLVDADGVHQIRTILSQYGQTLSWSRYVYLLDKTSYRECSPDGVTWGTCE